MSWVERLPSGRYRAKYRGDDGRQHSRTFPTKGAAKSFLQTVVADMQRSQRSNRRSPATKRSWATRSTRLRVAASLPMIVALDVPLHDGHGWARKKKSLLVCS